MQDVFQPHGQVGLDRLIVHVSYNILLAGDFPLTRSQPGRHRDVQRHECTLLERISPDASVVAKHDSRLRHRPLDDAAFRPTLHPLLPATILGPTAQLERMESSPVHQCAGDV